MKRTEAPNRYGRSVAKSAELPASPAAATNGSSGRQQLEAAIALASAAVLARMAPRFRWRGELKRLNTAITFGDGPKLPDGLADQFSRRRAVGRTVPAIR